MATRTKSKPRATAKPKAAKPKAAKPAAKPAKSRTFEQVVAAYPDDVRSLARATRSLVNELVPGALEVVDATGPYIGYGRTTGYKGMICTIIVSKGGVKLGLAGGATLPDPTGLLEGTGRVHRYIRIDSAADLQRPGVRPLMSAAKSRVDG